MFRKTSPVKKKFSAAKVSKPKRVMDPRTRLLLRQILLGGLVLLVVAVILAGIWYGSRLAMFTIDRVDAAGGDTIAPTEVVAVANEVLAGTYAGVIPRRFLWAYPETALYERLLQIPRLKDPVITRQGTTLSITYAEYTPYGLWCEKRTSDTCLFIDQQGFAFAPAPQLSGSAFPRFHTIGTAPQLRQAMLPAADLAMVEALRTAITNELALPVTYVETDIMRDVFLVVAGGGEIKATLRQSVDETIANLKSVLSAPQFTDIAPGTFQYIDVRFGSKVFVNEELPTIATSTATSTATSSDQFETPSAN